MANEEVFCREASLAAGEALYGTAAANTELWLALEVSEAWGPKGVEDSGLPADVVNILDELTRRQPRARVQLIRKPERQGKACTVYLAISREHGAEVHQTQLSQISDVAGLDLTSFAAGLLPPGFSPVREPVYLVCVHGKRDRCCAQQGMPLYTALNALSPEHTWQTTHLGGHRFAATMVVLPHGVAYGRLHDSEAAAIVEAHQRGRLHNLGRLRGRTCYAPPVQAAEYLVRERLGLLGLADLTLVSTRDDGADTLVSFRDGTGTEHQVTVTRQSLGAIPASCGAPPKPVDTFVQLRR